MLVRLFRRFRPTRSTAVPAEAAPAVAVAAAASAPADAMVPKAVGGLRLERSDDDLEAWLRCELALRCNVLRDALGTGSAANEARGLLDDLQSDAQAVIRQPPHAAQQALALTRDANTAVAELVRVFDQDPMLAQTLLRRANSSFYATGGGACVTLADAVRRIGMQGVEGVLFGSMVQGLLCRPGGDYDALAAEVWTHMVRTAPFARRLAPIFGVAVEQAFTLALLHDVGKLVVFDRLAVIRARLRRAAHLPPGFLDETLARLHEPLGGIAALSWGLGASSARAIATHHRMPLRYEQELLSEVLCVSERAEHAIRRREPLELEALWPAAAITAPLEVVREALLDAASAELDV